HGQDLKHRSRRLISKSFFVEPYLTDASLDVIDIGLSPTWISAYVSPDSEPNRSLFLCCKTLSACFFSLRNNRKSHRESHGRILCQHGRTLSPHVRPETHHLRARTL